MKNKKIGTKELAHEDPFTVVGIGASAGGLEAIQDYFSQMPSESGLAFVVVQHLSPDHKSMMNELLAKYTPDFDTGSPKIK